MLIFKRIMMIIIILEKDVGDLFWIRSLRRRNDKSARDLKFCRLRPVRMYIKIDYPSDVTTKTNGSIYKSSRVFDKDRYTGVEWKTKRL